MAIGLRQKILLLYLFLVSVRTADASGLNYQVSRGRYYSTVRIQSSGYLCISNSPSVTIKSISVKQCIQECFRQAGCDDFNVIDGGTGDVDCQLYVENNPLNYTVKANCQAYQVGIVEMGNFASFSAWAYSVHQFFHDALPTIFAGIYLLLCIMNKTCRILTLEKLFFCEVTGSLLNKLFFCVFMRLSEMFFISPPPPKQNHV